MSKTVRTSSISPPPGQQDQSARLAASAEVGQVEGTIHPVYQEYLDHHAVLKRMFNSGSYKGDEYMALLGGIAAIQTLLHDRGIKV